MFRHLSRTSNLHNFQNYLPRNPLISLHMRNVHTTSSLRDFYEITDDTDFSKRVMNSELPVIVNFHADWCGPCLALRPLLRKIAEENMDKMHLAEITIDDHAKLIQAFEVTAVPAVIAIHEGKIISKFIGLISNKEVEKFVEELLHGDPHR